MNNVDLKELVGGALQEKFSKSFERVVDNLRDVNTPYKNKRNITIKLTFEQNESRDDVKVAVDVVEKLSPQTPLSTSFTVGKDLRTGKTYAREYGKQLTGQIDIDSVSTSERDVDMETGEILEENNENIVDFRKVK